MNLKESDDKEFVWLMGLCKSKREDGYYEADIIPYTPIKLIDEMFYKISSIKEEKFDVEIGVVYCIEMAMNLLRRGFSNITMIVGNHDEKLKIQCDKLNIIYKVIDINGEDSMPKFDVVVGNPPYQKSTSGDVKNKQPIWPAFVIKSASLLKDNGYMAFITPRTWASGSNNKIKYYFKNWAVHYLNMNVSSHFKVVADICGFVIQNTKPLNQTNIIGVDSKTINDIKLKELDFIPFNITNTSLSIFNKTINIGDTLSTKNYQFTESKKQISEWSGARITFIAGRNGFYGKRIFAEKPPYQIKKGVGQIAKIKHISNEELNNLDKLLKLNIYIFIFDLLGGNRGLNKTWILNTLNVPTDLAHTWIDIELYDYFNLTQEEIDYIESNVK